MSCSSASSRAGFVLGVSVRNESEGLQLCATQLSCVSRAWQIKPLCKAGKRPAPLDPGEDFTIYLRLTRQESAPVTLAPPPVATAKTEASKEVDQGVEVTTSHFELNFTGQHVVDSRDVPLLSFLEVGHPLCYPPVEL